MKDRPWIWIIVAWIALLAGMAVVITICVRNAPESVPIETTYGH
jgi:hypothetical protein